MILSLRDAAFVDPILFAFRHSFARHCFPFDGRRNRLGRFARLFTPRQNRFISALLKTHNLANHSENRLRFFEDADGALRDSKIAMTL